MPRAAPTIPDESDALCEGCGYIINGLSDDSRCPECGKPIAESRPETRQPPAWESRRSFLPTSLAILFRPAAFYRFTTSRGSLEKSVRFAGCHWMLASLLMSIAVWMHVMMIGMFPMALPAVFILLTMMFITFWGTTIVAAKLTAWEAAYRGLRMPYGVVLRGLYYHAVHYVPAALLIFATVLGFCILTTTKRLGYEFAVPYLYLLSVEIVACAAYLFWTYWIAMRNIMYANR